MDERQQLEQAIATQESLRGTIDDEIINATILALREKLTALDQAPQQQRKLATILFMDISDHTALTRSLDPEEQMEVIDPAIARMAKKVVEFGGHVARYQGDGFKAVFGLPIAHENDPAQAIRSGLAIQAAAASIAKKCQDERGLFGFRVRVGITTGMVFSGGETEGEDTIKGEPVNLAARLESAAAPGTVLITHDCFKHVRGLFEVEPLDPLQLKGFSEPVAVYRVLREKERPFYRGMRGVEGIETRMVGREFEFQSLQKALGEVTGKREQRVVTVVGEAGLGKSRLLYEFENWVDLLPEQVWLYKGRARLESQGLPYSLLRDVFASRFEIQDDDKVKAVLKKFEQGFCELLGDSETSIRKSHIVGQLQGYDFSQSPHLKNLLNDPQQLRDRGLEHIREYFQSASHILPTIILLEDLHWADESSLESLSRLIQGLKKQPVLVIMTARHGLLERRPKWNDSLEYHKLLVLPLLTKASSQHMAAEVLQRVDDLPEDLIELIVSNAEGNPFYLEELIKMLIGDGVIIRQEPHWRVDFSRLKEIKVPSTLTGVLQARLDGLPENERKVLQGASVVGRVFWDRVLEHLNSVDHKNISETEIVKVLDELRSRELVFRRETSAFANAREHIFKHALLREVVYESVLKSVRRAYHALVADWLITHTGDREGEFIGQIANHLYLAQDFEKAFLYLQKAGEEAAGRFANEEAITFFARALSLAKEIGASREIIKQLYLRIGRLRELIPQWELALETYREMEAYSKKHADRQMELASLIAQTILFVIPSSLLKPAHAQVLGEKALALAREIGDQVSEAEILWSLCLVHYYQVNISLSIDAGEQSLALARKLNLQEQIAQTLSDLGGVSYSYLGPADHAFHPLEESSQLWRKMGNVPMLVNNLSALCNAHVFVGNYSQAITVSREALEISTSSENVWGQSYSQYMVGRAYWERGEISMAIKAMQESIRLGEVSGFIAPLSSTQADLGMLFGSLGAMELSLDFANKSIGHWSEMKGMEEIEMYPQGVLAYLYLMNGEFSKAEAILEKWKGYFADTSKVILHSCRTIYFAGIELAIKKGNLDQALSLIDTLLEMIHQSGWKSHIPHAYYLRGRVLFGLSRHEKARAMLQEARSVAETFGSRWIMWKILAELHLHETDPDIRETLCDEAYGHIQFISDHIEQTELQTSFLALPEVQSLCS